MDETAKKDVVALRRVTSYDLPAVLAALRQAWDAIGLDRAFFAGKAVVVKPNLVMKKSPDAAATTHPVVLDAVLTLLDEMDVHPVIAESPGGVYSRARLESIYRGCGIAEVAERHGATLNYDTEAVFLTAPNGRVTKRFHIIKPIADADVILDLCKLKSHALTRMSAAVKNLFGTIPGIEKFEIHATYPDYGDFAGMLCDLCGMLCETKEVIAVTDAIVAMEGNGPTAGSPRPIGALLCGRNPFRSDLVSETLLGFAGTVPLVREAISRGLCPPSIEDVTILGDPLDSLSVSDFREPDAVAGGTVGALRFFSGGKVGRLFMPRPIPQEDLCRGCGECAASCPQKTIVMEERRGKKIAHIHHADCIRCYCCQELCPFGAIRIKKNLILRIIGSL